jgi:hypothetical protein
MKLKFPKLDMDVLESKAQDLLLEAALHAVPTEETLDPLVDKLVTWLDDQISYGSGIVAKILDSYDHIVLRWILHMVVHRVYKELVDAAAFTD